MAAGRGAAAAGPPTGRGGGQSREWYRGLPIPPGALANWSRRNNANYMQTGVLSGLQLTAMFPNLVVENFYQKTRNSIESGKTDAPFAFVIPVQRDGTRVAELVNILRAQGIEVGRAAGEIKISDGTFPAGSYVIKRDQPYGRLAKNLLEVQSYPDPNLRTYDDSGWTMGLAMLADVREIKDKAILDTPTTLVQKATAEGKVTGNGSAGLAIAHYGSNNMVAFRYKLRNVPMKITDRATTIDGIDVPAGSFVVAPPADLAAVRSAVQQFGLTAVALSTLPTVPMHDGDLPRVAIYSSWSGTQEIGWVRFTFDKFGVPFDLIYKERVRKGNLRADYDVIVMPTQTLTRQSVFQPAAARPVPYMKDAKYKFLGMYGESPDITGGMGGEGVDAFAKFLDAGGTLVAMGTAVRFPTDMGFARTVEAAGATSSNFYAPRPLVNAEVLRLDHPVFYGYTDKTMPIKYIQGQPLISVGEPDRGDRAGALRGRRSGGAERPDARRRRDPRAPGRRRRPRRLHRQGPRHPVRQQPDLPLAEPRRVQHGVQHAAQLERFERQWQGEDRHGDHESAAAVSLFAATRSRALQERPGDQEKSFPKQSTSDLCPPVKALLERLSLASKEATESSSGPHSAKYPRRASTVPLLFFSRTSRRCQPLPATPRGA